MGIRIHKMLGYGLTDVDPVLDARLNRDSPVFRYALEGVTHVEEYFKWVEAHGPRSFDVAKSMLKSSRKRGEGEFLLQNCFQWGTADGGLQNVLCVRPLAWTDWYRYDSAIDYAEQTYSKKGQRDVVKVLNHGHYPHVGYMDARTGEPLPKDADPWGYWRVRNGGVEDLDTLDMFAHLAGFVDHAEASKFMVPLVPNEVRWLCEFAELFTDPTHVKDMRPLIYTWWS